MLFVFMCDGIIISNQSRIQTWTARIMLFFYIRQYFHWDTHVSRPHYDIIKWKHFPRNWPLVRGIHRSPVNSPHKGQWRGALMFSLICVWINGWVNNHEAADFRRYRAHYDVIVMLSPQCRKRELDLNNSDMALKQGTRVLPRHVARWSWEKFRTQTISICRIHDLKFVHFWFDGYSLVLFLFVYGKTGGVRIKPLLITVTS